MEFIISELSFAMISIHGFRSFFAVCFVRETDSQMKQKVVRDS